MGRDPKKAALGFGVLIAVLGLAAWRLLAPAAHAGDCNLSAQVCPASFDGQQLEIELVPRRPAPGEEFRLMLRPASGAPAQLDAAAITVELSMPGMDMGDHGTRLEPTPNGTLEGRMALPSCPMGHSLWQASVRAGETPIANLVLHVAPPPGGGPDSDARK
jgi:hypothetical protein